MRKLWIITGAVLILIGLAGIISPGISVGKPLPEFEKKWSFSSGELRDLTVRSDYQVDISFAKSTDGTNSVYVKGRGREKMIKRIEGTELSDGKLELDMRKPRGLVFSFYFGNDAKEEIIVMLADGEELESLGLHLDSDRLTVKDAQVKTADITVDSGSVTINGLTADKLSLEADSGSITGTGIHADSTVSADSGSITLKGLTGAARISADSGSVHVYRDDTADTDIKSDSGSVYVHLPSSFAGFFDLRADSGSIRAPDSKRETKDLVKVRTDSGSIQIEQE